MFYKQDALKNITNILRVYNSQFTKPLWNLPNKIDDYRYGLYTNNLSKSFTYHTIKNLTLPPQHQQSFNYGCVDKKLMYYINHTPTVSFAFRKNLYNTVVLYFLYLLVTTYLPPRLHFTLLHNFVILPKTFSFYGFCNSFYFRVWNY